MGETKKIIFLVGDEGPFNGGGKDKSELKPEESMDEYCANCDDDLKSVQEAVASANNPGKAVTIYGLWGDMTADIYTDKGKKDIEELFTNIATPTGGTAQPFRNQADIISLITKKVGRGEYFDKGYNKYRDLSLNRIPADKKYYFTKAYEDVRSNSIYIVDWAPDGNEGNHKWSYPYIDPPIPGVQDKWSNAKFQKTPTEAEIEKNPLLKGTTTPFTKPVTAYILDEVKDNYK